MLLWGAECMSLSVCSSLLTGSAINSTYIIILCKFVFDFLESRHGQTHKYFNIFGSDVKYYTTLQCWGNDTTPRIQGKR